MLKPDGFAFAPHPMLVDTDRDKYCVQQIIDFYQRQNTDYADYFQAAWRYKHRAALGQPTATLADIAAEAKRQPEVPGDGLGAARRHDGETSARSRSCRRCGESCRRRTTSEPTPRERAASAMRDFVVAAAQEARAAVHEPRAPGVNAAAASRC